MSRRRTTIVAGLVLACGPWLVACGDNSSGEPSAASVTVTETVTAQPGAADAPASPAPSTPSVPAPTAAGDVSACDAMGTVFAKLGKAAAEWDPTKDPFDADLARTISLLTKDMVAAERTAATGDVRSAIHENTTAYTGLTRTMAGTSRTHVFDRVGDTQLAYGSIKRVCALG